MGRRLAPGSARRLHQLQIVALYHVVASVWRRRSSAARGGMRISSRLRCDAAVALVRERYRTQPAEKAMPSRFLARAGAEGARVRCQPEVQKRLEKAATYLLDLAYLG